MSTKSTKSAQPIDARVVRRVLREDNWEDWPQTDAEHAEFKLALYEYQGWDEQVPPYHGRIADRLSDIRYTLEAGDAATARVELGLLEASLDLWSGEKHEIAMRTATGRPGMDKRGQ